MQNKGPGKLNKRYLCCIIKVTSKSLIITINRGKKGFFQIPSLRIQLSNISSEMRNTSGINSGGHAQF